MELASDQLILCGRSSIRFWYEASASDSSFYIRTLKTRRVQVGEGGCLIQLNYAAIALLLQHHTEAVV